MVLAGRGSGFLQRGRCDCNGLGRSAPFLHGTGRRAFALTAGILYAVAMVLFPVYFFFVLIQMILCFVAFAKMSKASSVTA